MTRDDITRMAREAGSIDSEGVIETVYAAFTAAEREACAKVCDAVVDQLRATHLATLRQEDFSVLRGAELVADALKETREGEE